MGDAGATRPENALIPSVAMRSGDDCESSGVSGGLTQAIHFSSGNPRIEETRGVIHLYPQEDSSSSSPPLLPVERKPMVCVVAVPNHMTYADFCGFCGSFFQQMLEMKVVRNDGMKDQYSILITFDGQCSADSFYQHFNGKRFSSLEVDVCHVLYTLDVQYTGSIEHAQKSLPSAGEQPTCPVCLERLDQDTSGILTTICNHSFHSSCISKWADSSCPVCRYCQQQPEKSTCSICGTSENLWICVICGFVGCGRYKEGHAIRHWKETQHCYSLDLESQRVWDYVGDNYVHRLIHSKTDGKPVELNFQCAHADDMCGGCECGADSAVSEALINSKLDAEYNNLLASQVEDQRKYYNLLLQEIKEEQEKEISETLEKALNSKLQKLQAKLEKCLQEKKFLGDINENLKKNQDMWKEKIVQIEERERAAVRLRNEKIQALDEQLQRLIVQIEAQESVDELPESRSGDIQGDPSGDIKGDKILPVPNTSSSRSNVDQTGSYLPTSSSTGIASGAIAGITVAGVVLLSVGIGICFILHRRKKAKNASLILAPFEDNSIHHTHAASDKTPPLTPRGSASPFTGITVDKSVEFTYQELSKATSDFDIANKIGEGGFGAVYYAELRGEKAAIKKMDMQASREFLAELKVLTHVHHLNLVRLIGYCTEVSLFLVYEYIENGNLSEHLRGSDMDPLPWSGRVQIALDSARGLEYIHEHTVPVYIHRDIKSANILIDKNFHGKVADFGLTKLTEVGSSSLPTRLVGTFGYMPPEYAQYGDVSPKVDVYAFGVVLYELISAKEAIVKSSESVTESKGLVALFEEALNQPDPREDLRKLVDPRLGDNCPVDSIHKMAQLAKACTQENPQLRPSMRSIVVALMTLSSSTEDWDMGSFYENQALVNLMSGR